MTDIVERSAKHRQAIPGIACTAQASPGTRDSGWAASDEGLLQEWCPIILVAEDNRINRMVIQHILKSLSAEVVYAENGREAVDAATASAFDFILMDIQMPELDGVEATLQIRSMEVEDPGRSRAVIIATTANTMAHQIERYLASGIDACVAKPIRKEGLFRVLADSLRCDPREG